MSKGTSPTIKRQPNEPNNFLKKGNPPLQLFELTQIIWKYGRSSDQYKDAIERRLREQKSPISRKRTLTFNN